MNKRMDEILDQLVEAEKRRALKWFKPLQVEDLQSSLGQTHAGSWRVWLSHHWIWAASAMAIGVLMVLGGIALHQTTRSLEGTGQNVELALSRAVAFQKGTDSLALSIPESADSATDLYWNVQAALCRVQLNQFSGQKLDAAILYTISKGQTQPGPPVRRKERVAASPKYLKPPSAAVMERLLSRFRG
jgi:hypothetical protein